MSAANLREWLEAEIAANGPMTVERYMRECLLHERFGYYRSRQAIGAGGDFITAPEISQIFGELIGIWVASAWAELGSPKRWRLVELGPGRGTLMADLLRALKVLPAANAGIEVVLVEANRVLAGQQRAVLAGRGPAMSWMEATGGLGALEPLPTVLIANEFLDALPIRQSAMSGGKWHERRIIVDQGLKFEGGADPGAIREEMSGAASLIAELAAIVPAYHLFIDYGHEGPVFGDTLQAVAGHRFTDPLAAPGEADLSAQVDFAQVRGAALAAGLEALGPITQGEFLGRLGAAERLQRLGFGKDAATIHSIQTALARLMQPDGMGGRFKALAMASKGLVRPPAF